MAEESTPEEPKPKKKYSWTLVIITALFFSPLIWIALPQGVGECGSTKYNGARANLHRLHSACRGYWREKGGDKECNLTIAIGVGFVHSTQAKIEAHGIKSTFTATFQHMDSATSCTMDANGNITKKK